MSNKVIVPSETKLVLTGEKVVELLKAAGHDIPDRRVISFERAKTGEAVLTLCWSNE